MISKQKQTKDADRVLLRAVKTDKNIAKQDNVQKDNVQRTWSVSNAICKTLQDISIQIYRDDLDL